MNEMIERGVAALKRLPVRDLSNPGGELDELRLREAVRAVVEAMRVPTEDMAAAAECAEPFSFEAMWKAAIDEALK